MAESHRLGLEWVGDDGLPLKRWLRICSKMAAKLTNSSDESSMGSAVYFSSKVFTENLGGGGERVQQGGRARVSEVKLQAGREGLMEGMGVMWGQVKPE